MLVWRETAGMSRRRLAFTVNADQPHATINTAWLRLLPNMAYGRIQHRLTNVTRPTGIAEAARPRIRALLGERSGTTTTRYIHTTS
jgi:hypothetical protein